MRSLAITIALSSFALGVLAQNATSCPETFRPDCAFLDQSKNACSPSFGLTNLGGGFLICPGVLVCNGNAARCPYECKTTGSLGDHTFCNIEDFTTDERVKCSPCGGDTPTETSATTSPTASETGTSVGTACPETFRPECAFLDKAKSECSSTWGIDSKGVGFEICPGVLVCNGNAARCPYECKTSGTLGDHTFCNVEEFTSDPRVKCTQCGTTPTDTPSETSATESATATETGNSVGTACPETLRPECAFLDKAKSECSSTWGIDSNGAGFEICPGVLVCNGNAARCPYECTTSGTLGTHTFCNVEDFTADPRVKCSQCGETPADTSAPAETTPAETGTPIETTVATSTSRSGQTNSPLPTPTFISGATTLANSGMAFLGLLCFMFAF
ncbi:hypothetical protein H072_8026 [Dactylellina haptotyla CBS 200.50]|uniref:Uncharacterized protein n=1 Tax=Dactylellina haptotyla (strain CBS 200.50) TaxID=1284197 RepID=S8A5Z6_DACHA|nr:hypothetical protein H072_8026 [Dactylellina haptotyla CBS 200.50]